MRRQCTDSENQIIRGNAESVLISPSMYKKRYNSSLLPLVLGMLAGIGLGTLFVVSIPNPVTTAIKGTLFFCGFVVSETFILVWHKVIKKIRGKKVIPGEQFSINGGTVIAYMQTSKKEAYLVFTEDGPADMTDNPWCIKYPALPDMQVQYGERILIVQNEAGAYIPLKLTERTRGFIPEREPEYFYKVDWSGAACFPHPAAATLEKESYRMSEAESAELIKRCSRLKGVSAGNWIGIILFSLLFLLLCGIVFIGMFADKIADNPIIFTVGVVVLIVVWVLLTLGMAKVVLAGKTRGLGKLRYRKRVMFHSISDEHGRYMYTKCVSVYENRNGNIELVTYPVRNTTALPKDLPYGKVIYRYSQVPNGGLLDLNVFCTVSVM